MEKNRKLFYLKLKMRREETLQLEMTESLRVGSSPRKLSVRAEKELVARHTMDAEVRKARMAEL